MNEEITCKHTNAIRGGEYISEGKNLVGKQVKAVLKKIDCPDCKTDRVFIKAL